ncbi:MAG: cupin domain-containing protein [Melioribacteraceae bacterium]|nr:cupin domain-containing protein [Melioribacteraceae bacterium]
MKILFLRTKILFVITLICSQYNFSQTKIFIPQITFPDEIKWNSSDNKNYSIETFNLLGNPNENDFYVQMVKIPANTKLLPHFHPDNRTVYVIDGEFFYCYEKKYDEAKAKKIIKGSFFTEPSNQPHFAFTKESHVILYVTGFGPSKTTFIDNE